MDFARQVSSKARAVIAGDITKDLVQWSESTPGLVVRLDLKNLSVASKSIDIVICRSVLEHISQPMVVLHELFRVLKPKGHFIFLTPNLYDYVSIIAILTPHRLHQWLLNRLLKWDSEDIFPTTYKMNTTYKIRRLMHNAGFKCVELN